MPVWPLRALMTLSANLRWGLVPMIISQEGQGTRPVAGKSHGQSSGTSTILGLNDLITTELDTCKSRQRPEITKLCAKNLRLIRASYLSAGIWKEGETLLKRGTMVSPE